jgi:hypothetical protein
MPIRHRFAASLTLIAGLGSAHAAVISSDGSDGVFHPTSSTVLYPDADGIFHFTSVTIPEDVLVSVDAQGLGGNVVFASMGDIVVNGALDARHSTLELHTPGRVTIQGKVYGANFRIVGNEAFFLDNPNGNSDQRLYGGVDISFRPDGYLKVDQPYESIWAGSLSGGVTFYSFVVDSLPDVELVADPPPAFEFVILTPIPQLEAIPLPPAVWLLGSGLAAIPMFGRSRRR